MRKIARKSAWQGGRFGRSWVVSEYGLFRARLWAADALLPTLRPKLISGELRITTAEKIAGTVA
jgi:hypothetical protein